jgi:long-chain acyl-CoA synthetase
MSEKIWLKNYPPRVPAEINPQAYESVVDLFEQSCIKYADKWALSNFGSRISYSQLQKLSSDFAAYLQGVLQLQKGERIAIMLPNIMQYYVAMFGALRAGLIVVNVNPLYTPRELMHQLTDSGAVAIVIMSNFLPTLEKVLEKTPLRQVISTHLADLFPFPKRTLFNCVLKYIKKEIPPCTIKNSIAFKQALAIGEHTTFVKIPLQRDDVAYLQYTGGTTGIPKAAVLTHGNMVANVEQAYAWVMADNLQEGREVVILPLPLYHIFSLTTCALAFLKMGGMTVLVTDPRNIKYFLCELAKTPFSVMIGINTLYHALLQHKKFLQLKFPHLKLAVAGGMPLQQMVAEQWYQLTGIPILEGYGLTEASPIVTINPINTRIFSGSIGLPISSTDVVVRNGNGGADLPWGEEGELCVKGPQVMREYWNNPAETHAVFTQDGWLRTGDIAKLDQEGFVYVIDRKKDMILVSGFNVYPNEVESILVTHPGVLEAGVVGVASDTTGEAVKAYIVRRYPSVTVNDIITFCRERLTGYKIPKLIEFVEQLPKTNVGKVLRRELRE